MKIILGYRLDFRKDKPVETYARCFHQELELRGHTVHPFGEGHEVPSPIQYDYKAYDLMIELDCGRSRSNEHGYLQPELQLKIPSAIWYIDSHGHPSLHKRMSEHYDHVFFAVWSKRDLFYKHPSAHWCPCATDLKHFGYKNFLNVELQYDFGFFGSKGGLGRADALKEVCEKNGWSYDVRQVSKPFRHKWPQTGGAMRACSFLFNHSQKHDAPNQRVMESMAMNRPLLTDNDPIGGMSKLFVDGYHYIGYESYTYADLEEKCKWVVDHPDEVAKIAEQAYDEVRAKHTIASRVEQVLEVVS